MKKTFKRTLDVREINEGACTSHTVIDRNAQPTCEY